MSAYLQKAHNNIVMAEILIENGMPHSSAHPAYYSAFLSVKYFLAHFLSIGYSEQEEMAKGKDSHKVLSETALKAMATSDKATGPDYFTWYNHLRKMRRSADYKPVPIAKSDLQDNINIAKSFLGSVDSHFKTI